MPSAEQLGLVPKSKFPTKLKVGTVIEANGLPRFEQVENFGEAVIIPTVDGEVSTFGSNIISNLRSEKDGSIGTLLRKAVDQGTSLTLYCAESSYKGKNMLKLSQYDIRS